MADASDVMGPWQPSPDQGNSVHHAAPPDDGGQGVSDSLPMSLVTRLLVFPEALTGIKLRTDSGQSGRI